MAKGGQKDHSGMDDQTYDRHYRKHKRIGGHHGPEEIKDPPPAREESYDKSPGEITPLNQVGIVDPALATQQRVAQQIPQAVQPMTNVPPALSNTLGQARPVFNQQAQQNAQGMFGGIDQRQNSVGAPLMFKDQTGDGKITQADIIKARKEGYKK